ncbi:hypothetical protein F5Y18DRAFT_401970 [Xylariaceae sp. FL1019]|nr:hypothetical protein F5Y18DRAFT_401970 [Xylariaceae sp. FL1019]
MRDCLVRHNDGQVDFLDVGRIPPEMEEESPFSFYLLHLCKRDLSIADALLWLDKISGIRDITAKETWYMAQVAAQNRMANICFILRFMEALTEYVDMPTFKRAKSQRFRDGTRNIKKHLDKIKESVDLAEYVFPFRKLGVPGGPEQAAKALDEAVKAAHTFPTLELWFSDVVDRCAHSLEERLHQASLKQKENEAAEARKQDKFVPVLIRSPPRSPPRRRNDRDEPQAQSDDGNTEPDAPPVGPPAEAAPTASVPVPTLPVFTVKAADKAISGVLFGSGTGSLRWTDFLKLMTSIGFSVNNATGSVVKFRAPDDLNHGRVINIHHPHPRPDMDAKKRLNIARRLTRVYGIDKDSFETEA